jgi:hypothetical protein
MEMPNLLKNLSLDDKYLFILCHGCYSFFIDFDLSIAHAQGSVVFYRSMTVAALFFIFAFCY